MKAQIVGTLSVEARTYLRDWVRQEPLDEVTKSSYVSGRKEKWYRLGSNLQCIQTGRDKLFAATEPPQRLIDFGDRLLLGWHSLLVCGGKTTITAHRDHGHFEAEAVMINLGGAVYAEHIGAASESISLCDGDVVRLDIKVTHSSRQLSDERFNFTFRRVKPEFLASASRERQHSLDEVVG